MKIKPAEKSDSCGEQSSRVRGGFRALQGSLSSRERGLIAFGSLLVVTAGVYIPGLFQEIVDLDYSCWVQAVQPLGIGSLKEVLLYDSVRWKDLGYFAPLTALSFMADLWFGSVVGSPEVVHKAVNLLLHFGNVGLVLWLMRVLGFRRWTSFSVAALFALHPLQVSSLEWVAERKNLLMSCFVLWGLILYCFYHRTRRAALYRGAIGCFSLALLCKPAAVVFGVCVLLTDLLLLERRMSARAFLRSAPFLVVGMLWALVAIKTETGITEPPPLLQRLLLAPYSLEFLAGKFFAPFGLTFLYPAPNVDPASWFWWIPAVGMVVCLGVMVVANRHEPYRAVVWGCAFYLVNLIPSSGIVPFSGMMELWTADHYQYLAIIGLALAVVVLVEEISAMLSEQWSRVMRYAATAGAVAVLAILSQSQVKVWSTPESLWKHALENNPRSFMAHLNYGSVLQERGRCDEAEPILRRALAMNDRHIESCKICYNLGLISERKGAMDHAVGDFQKSLELNPGFGPSHLALARLLLIAGQFPQSLEHCLQANQLGTSCDSRRLKGLIAAESLRRLRDYVRQ